VLFIKNRGTGNYTVTANGTDTIDGVTNTRITLNHSPQSSVVLQAYTTTQWQILAHYGTTSLGT
jgi:hypothetical protein